MLSRKVTRCAVRYKSFCVSSKGRRACYPLRSVEFAPVASFDRGARRWTLLRLFRLDSPPLHARYASLLAMLPSVCVEGWWRVKFVLRLVHPSPSHESASILAASLGPSCCSLENAPKPICTIFFQSLTFFRFLGRCCRGWRLMATGTSSAPTRPRA